MRSNLKRFLTRLVLIALITQGVNVRLSAHDFPPDRTLDETATSNCFSSSTAAVVHPAETNAASRTEAAQFDARPASACPQHALLRYALRQTCPSLAALIEQPKFWKWLGQSKKAIASEWTRTQNSIDSAGVTNNNALAITPPDVGVAPHPTVQALVAATADSQPAMDEQAGSTTAASVSCLAITPPDVGVAPRPDAEALAVTTASSQHAVDEQADATSTPTVSWLAIAPPDTGVAPRPAPRVFALGKAKVHPAMAGEVYMPYDFRMSDWRFGQFPCYGKTATAPLPAALPSLVDGLPSVPALTTPSLAEESQASPATRRCEALGRLLEQVEKWQCVSSDALHSGAAFAGLAEAVPTSMAHFVVGGLPHAAYTLSNLSQSLWTVSEPRVASGPHGDQF